MSEFSPNQEQQRLIENTEGVYLVDAGAGTGKTFTITRRYIEILEEEDPESIFLATFTRNAADEMKERIAGKSDYSASKIHEAPITTFHAHCQDILERIGHESPQILGIDSRLPENIQVMESQVRESQEFESFLERFKDRNRRYEDFFRIAREGELLDLLKSLAAKGVIPEEKGWFSDTGEYLDGDFENFRSRFKQKNKPVEKEGGERQSELRRRLYSYKYKNFSSQAPSSQEIRGGYGTKKVRKDFCRKAFEEDREELKKFVHDLYYSYLSYCVSKNYLNFSFLMALTYVLLYERQKLRKKEMFDYVMIDEFQDTNEIQFKISLMLSSQSNLCAVGDWKQSIYSFQHASVQNITRFKQRLEKYSRELGDRLEADFLNSSVQEIRLKKNYRSGQEILDKAEQALELPANSYENPEEAAITSLESQVDGEGEVKRIEAEDEKEAILAKIQDLEMDYGDVAVLSRTRSFGLELQSKAREHGIPAVYEGGVELFTTPPAITLLAWLRIVQNRDSRKGWAVVLEEAGYTLREAEKILEDGEYPSNLLEFRQELENLESVAAVSERVFDRYGYRNGFTEKIIQVLGETFSNTYMNLGQIIEFIERNIEEDEIYEVDGVRNGEAVTVQTIHAAKGLEYPTVFVSDVNQGSFPSTSSFPSNIFYRDPIGLRQRKKYMREDYSYAFDNWKTEILEKSLSGEYDEERRLMYVAMTRAEHKLYITAEEGRDSPFFSELDVEKEESAEAAKEVSEEKVEKEVFRI